MKNKNKALERLKIALLKNKSYLDKDFFDDNINIIHYAKTKEIANELKLSLATVRKYIKVALMFSSDYKWDKNNGTVYLKTIKMKTLLSTFLLFFVFSLFGQTSEFIFVNSCPHDYVKGYVKVKKSGMEFEYMIPPNSEKKIKLVDGQWYIIDIHITDECGNIIDKELLNDHSNNKNWKSIQESGEPTKYHKDGLLHYLAPPNYTLRYAKDGCTEDIKP